MAHDPKNKKEMESRLERRFLALPVEIEQRADNAVSRTIFGYAAKFNTWSDPIYGWFREKIDPAAFNNVLDQDTVCLFNHDKNKVLARNKVTLKLSVDAIGLRYEFEAPNTTSGNDVLEDIRLKNIVSSSFAFTTKRAEWAKSDAEGVEEDRTILEVETLIDVSPVTFPAYPDATVDVAKREFDGYVAEHRAEDPPKPISYQSLEDELELIKLK